MPTGDAESCLTRPGVSNVAGRKKAAVGCITALCRRPKKDAMAKRECGRVVRVPVRPARAAQALSCCAQQLFTVFRTFNRPGTWHMVPCANRHAQRSVT